MHQMSVKEMMVLSCAGIGEPTRRTSIYSTLYTYIYILTCYATEKNDDIYRSG